MLKAAPRLSHLSGGRKERLREIIKRESLLTGSQFKLASGQNSPFYFDMKKTMFHPEGIALVADVVYDAIKADTDVQYIGGLELGAVPIITAVCLRSSTERQLFGFVVRKEAKLHGTKNLIAGQFRPGATVILIDDVTTEGGSVMQAVRAAREQGCSIKKIITIVDRLAGADANLRREGIELVPIYTKDDFVD